jgi:hypothetical protein
MLAPACQTQLVHGRTHLPIGAEPYASKAGPRESSASRPCCEHATLRDVSCGMDARLLKVDGHHSTCGHTPNTSQLAQCAGSKSLAKMPLITMRNDHCTACCSVHMHATPGPMHHTQSHAPPSGCATHNTMPHHHMRHMYAQASMHKRSDASSSALKRSDTSSACTAHNTVHQGRGSAMHSNPVHCSMVHRGHDAPCIGIATGYQLDGIVAAGSPPCSGDTNMHSNGIMFVPSLGRGHVAGSSAQKLIDDCSALPVNQLAGQARATPPLLPGQGVPVCLPLGPAGTTGSVVTRVPWTSAEDSRSVDKKGGDSSSAMVLQLGGVTHRREESSVGPWYARGFRESGVLGAAFNDSPSVGVASNVNCDGGGNFMESRIGADPNFPNSPTECTGVGSKLQEQILHSTHLLHARVKGADEGACVQPCITRLPKPTVDQHDRAASDCEVHDNNILSECACDRQGVEVKRREREAGASERATISADVMGESETLRDQAGYFCLVPDVRGESGPVVGGESEALQGCEGVSDTLQPCQGESETLQPCQRESETLHACESETFQAGESEALHACESETLLVKVGP